MVREFPRFLLEHFAIKVIAIEEAKDTDAMKIDELIGSLQKIKMNLDESKKNKLKDEKIIILPVIISMAIASNTTIEEF
ncbi:hypothetical protein J1N35_035067 [Gossypium stocksii]|uniref:Uncharacterized protein n=1 Tax=Gossypium stocksii TaxID=47602 RepID=A0A9D3UTA1_9ROSI|nr:hypothetical protein J1N35_035067 [Gossypium stocksii]